MKITDEMLVKSFPNLYSDRHGDMCETCMCWGFECNLESWGKLIWDLSRKLEAEIVKYRKENPEKDFPRASQVKEKFGSLRFYMTFSTEAMDKLIDEAENKSYITCEDCGRKGKIRSVGGWYRCSCSICYFKRKFKFKKRLLKSKIQRFFK